MAVLVVILALSLLILVHEAGHFFAAKFFGVRVDEFGLGFPPRIFGKKIGETTYSINALPIGGFVKIYGENEAEADESKEDFKRSFASQSAWRRSVIMLAGVFMNLALAWLAISFVFMVGVPEHLAVAEVASNSPAEMAGMKSQDIILGVSFEGKVLQDPIKSNDFIEFVKGAPTESYSLTIKRGEDVLNISVAGRADPPKGEGAMGVVLLNIGFPQKSFLGSFWSGLTATWDMLKMIVIAFYGIISKIFTSPEILDTLAGPVGIFFIAKEAGGLGFVYLIQITAVISLNLVVLNLLPFPALDGGRFLMVIIEKIKGSPIPRNIQVAVNVVGLVLLVALMVVVTIKDVGRFIL